MIVYLDNSATTRQYDQVTALSPDLILSILLTSNLIEE